VSPDKILLVFALEDEAQNRFAEFPTLFCGMGKVNATLALTDALTRHKVPPAMVVNLGSAGSALFSASQLLNCTGFVERDMDLTPIGLPPYVTAVNVPAVLRYGLRVPAYTEAVCGSGDSFVTTASNAQSDAPLWQVVDMEAFALARVCQKFGVPFTCLKYITDGADDAAAQNWRDVLVHAAVNLRTALDAVLAHEDFTCA
jgi:adenosylhomocysteine nucleosidase